MGDDDKKLGESLEFYYPPNRLAKRIVDADGPSLQEMEAEAAKLLLVSKDDYARALEKTFVRMRACMAEDIGEDERHRKLFEDAHDIKGQAPIFGFPLVANVAICLCVVLLEAPEKFVAHKDLLQLHLDALKWAYINQNNEKLDAEKAALVQSLRNAVERED